MHDIPYLLRNRFGHAAFRGVQESIVSAVMSGRDVLAVMPTGSGKSLCYQLPSLMLPGTTLVVSPLISLMKDQVDTLNRRGVAAAALHSLLTLSERRTAIAAASAGKLRLLYVAPERFASSAFLPMLTELPVARFVVDEAHCVSEWGHDFRPDYGLLREAAARCRRSDGARGRPAMAAFTATATADVRAEIVRLLGLEQPHVIVSGFDRPNIFLSVQPVSDEQEKHERLSHLVGGRRALVYTSTRRSAEAVASSLRRAWIKTEPYHAGLPDEERTRVQEAFAAGSLRVVAATNAFGMGIDRPDVEAVVHFAIPGSLEAYYQEIGRAGRDGRLVTATLLWHRDDIRTREFLIDSPRQENGRRHPPLTPDQSARRREAAHARLQHMIGYGQAGRCLRAIILRHFGETPREPCGACSHCVPQGVLDQYDRERLRRMLAGIAEAGEGYGRRRVVAMLMGDPVDVPARLAAVGAAGMLRHEDKRVAEQWIDAAIAGGLLRVSPDHYRTLGLTPRGRAVVNGCFDDVRLTGLRDIATCGATNAHSSWDERWSRRAEWW